MERAAKSQSDRQHGRPARRARLSTSVVAFIDNRPEAVAQRELADAIHNSPYMVAQRKQLNFSGVRVHTDAQSDQLNQSIPQPSQPVVQPMLKLDLGNEPPSWYEGVGSLGKALEELDQQAVTLMMAVTHFGKAGGDPEPLAKQMESLRIAASTLPTVSSLETNVDNETLVVKKESTQLTRNVGPWIQAPAI